MPDEPIQVPAPPSRDRLRTLTVGAAKQFASKTVEHTGVTFELRQPSIGVRDELEQAAIRLVKGQRVFSMADFRIRSVIACTYDPATGERVFELADFDSLKGMPTGGFVDTFANEILVLMNVTAADGGDAKAETEKNSDGTAEVNGIS